MRGVRQVGKLCAKLEDESFLEREITNNGKIGIPHARLAENVEPRVSEVLSGHGGESRGVIIVLARPYMAEELDVRQNLVRRLRVRAAVIQRSIRRAHGEGSATVHGLPAA